MEQTAFHDYYIARTLENLSSKDKFVPVYASSNSKVYPFQIAAANFALRSPYQKGAVLCDEAGLGKSHEAMLVIAQKWFEGQHRILLAVPNADLLFQWTKLIDDFYSVPYVIISSRSDWDTFITQDELNPFLQDAIVITTYDFAANNEEAAKAVPWDLTVFEEANALSSVYQEGNRQAKALKQIAGSSFKQLLTGTPIEKDIMDLYGLIWFIDETVLPDEREFLARYLRRPEHYPELSERVRPYCFRTLRAQAQSYAKVTRRVLITNEYAPSPQEQRLYDLLYAYINQPVKQAFPEMDQYDLALRLLGLQGSSTDAIRQTIQGVIKRLSQIPNAQDELIQWQQMEIAAGEVYQDAKAVELLEALQLGFVAVKKRGAAPKAVIFTESIETQKMLLRLLQDRYKTLLYHGGADHTAIRQFKRDGEILISTDNGARGFNLEEAAFVIHYDLPYNTLKMEQRIDRCQRLGQENDVLSLAFMPDTLDGLSMNLEQTNLGKLRAVFPECFAEGKLDIDKLLSLCGEYIDNDFEKYRFEWKGKAECLRLAQKRSAGTLRPCPEESVNWDSTQNLYIEGDNLEVLKLLQSAYYRKVKMIYIDPPYNTGNDFVYADDFDDPLARYKEVTAQTTKSNPETMGRFHTNWLNMMYPRLRLAANLLRDDGVIFISIDDGEVTNLRRLCDEVFGEENFVAQFIWKCRQNKDNRNISGVSVDQEYIICYSKQFGNRVFRGTERKVEQYKNPDFFSGSATTAHAVMQLNSEDNGNRRFILVQLPEKTEIDEYPTICEIGKERIRRAGAQITTGDTGFRVFKLDLKTWDAAPIEGEALGTLYERMNGMVQRVKPDRSDLDMVFEVMLKLGVPPTYAVSPVSINGKTANSVGEDCLLLVCLAPDVQPEDVEQMAEYTPAKCIISRDSFEDDTAMANAYYILRDRGVELKLV